MADRGFQLGLLAGLCLIPAASTPAQCSDYYCEGGIFTMALDAVHRDGVRLEGDDLLPWQQWHWRVKDDRFGGLFVIAHRRLDCALPVDCTSTEQIWERWAGHCNERHYLQDHAGVGRIIGAGHLIAGLWVCSRMPRLCAATGKLHI